MSRSYRHWMECVSAKQRESPGLDLVVRHDVDYDIGTMRKMLEIERELGISSVIYIDLHSGSYGLPDIVALYRDYHQSHRFGIHINVAYENEGEAACCEAFDNDLALLRANGIMPHSCAAHYYNENVIPIPTFHNGHVEAWSHHLNLMQQEYYPQAFSPVHFYGAKKTIHLTDSGGILPEDGILSFLDSLKDGDKAYLLTHPVHYEANGSDVIYVKRCGEYMDPREAQERLKGKLTPYLAMPPLDLPHLIMAHKIITSQLRQRYAGMIRVVDAGCGIGLLGAYLLAFNNVKYTGFDISEEFIKRGKAFFALQGLCPKLYTEDFYKHQPPGDILAFLGYEDCQTDYDQLVELCANYPEVLITIAGDEMYAAAEARGKHYNYIGEKAFEEKFSRKFEVVESHPYFMKRTLYWLKRRNDD